MTTSFTSTRLTPLTLSQASPQQQAELEQGQRQVGFIPNMYACMAHAPGLLATYLQGYGAFRQHAGFTPAEQEVIFLAISQENQCDYCVAAHNMLAEKKSAVPAPTLQAIRSGQAITEPRLAALYAFARDMVQTRGRPCPRLGASFLEAGYSETQVLYLILAIGVKTLSNFANHYCQTPLDEVFAGFRLA
ncbi:MAG: carboxymuconolactone decarboxylase family protein [Neisseriaceae bacterium]|nr:MAG: carboxymuconolactone decarboxylase family protein [Neisseriaceae bacterium]